MKRKRAKTGPITVDLYPFPWRFERGKYTELYLMSSVTESRVQADIVSALKNYRVDAMPIDAGGRRARGVMMGIAKNAGISIGSLANVKTGAAIPSGFADLEATLAPSGRSLYIEVKAPAWYSETGLITRAAGEPSAAQLEFLLAKHKRGAIVMVAWASIDVVVYLEHLLVQNRRAVNG